MVRAEAQDQPVPRFTWRSLAGLFDEAWEREQRRRRWCLVAIVLLVAAGVFAAVLTGGGGNGSPRPSIAALRPHTPRPTATGSSSPARSRFALFNQPSASPQAVRRSIRNEPGLASSLTSKNGGNGIGHPATHIIHTPEGTVWVVTGYGLGGAALPRRRFGHGARITFRGAASCLIMPGPSGAYWGCGPLVGHNTITGANAGAGGYSATWYGLVPNSVKRVIVSYPSGHKITVPVVDNTFLVHLRGPWQQCLTRRSATEAATLSTTAKTFTVHCGN